MRRLAVLALVLMLAAPFARADMSACSSAYTKKSLDEKISLYTICITHGQMTKGDLAGAFANRGVAYLAKGDFDHALEDFTQSIHYDPKFGIAYLNRAVIYLSRGQLEPAQADLTATLAHPPARVWAEAHLYRGLASMSGGNCGEALRDFDAALKRDHRLAWGHAAKAWVLATCPEDKWRNGGDALQAAQQALVLEDHWKLHDVLAAAYAESGRFEDSVRELRLAQEKSPGSESASPWKAGLQARLALYQAHQPYRQPVDMSSTSGEWLAAIE